MVSREQVIESLQTVTDPILHKSLTELQLIRDIMAKEDKIALTVIGSTEDEGLRSALREQIVGKLREIGAVDVHVRFRSMSDRERAEAEAIASGKGQAAAEQSANGPAAAPVKGHGAGLEKHPLLNPNNKVTFIAVASGKGGVGKSTVTANLAVALARQGKKVGLIDADIYGFSIPDMMGIEERPAVSDDLIAPIERFGVKVMSTGFFVEENSPVVWRGPKLGKMLRSFLSEVNWGELDFMLLDLPPGTGDIALDVHQMIPQSKEIIVTTPHATAAFVAARAGTMAIQTNHEIIGVIENMAYYECGSCGNKDYIFGRGGGAKLAESLHCDLLAQIPLGIPDNHPSEPDFSPSVYKAESDTGRIYLDVAAKIIDKCQQD